MRKGWMLVICLIAVSFIAATGCTMTQIEIPNYSEAKALQKADDFQGAIAKYEAYVAENKDGVLVPYAKFHVAECYIGMRDVEKATAAYNAVKKDFAGTEPAVWAEEDLEMLKSNPDVILPPEPEKMEAPAGEAKEAK